MSQYLRPPIAAPEFRDADGRPIEYGRRWHGSPPAETYSVDTHPERFAPLHTVAEAIITHLRERFEVRVSEGHDHAADLVHPARDVVRAVRVQPNDPSCAALTFVFTGYPGIFLHAGVLHDFHYPSCGCDACDSNWTMEADELERHVFAVVEGGYRERVVRGPDPEAEFSIGFPDGSSSGRARLQGTPAERVEAAGALLDRLTDGWTAWPRRVSDAAPHGSTDPGSPRIPRGR
jgi:hypothetical protein